MARTLKKRKKQSEHGGANLADAQQTRTQRWFLSRKCHVVAVLHIDEQFGRDAQCSFHHQSEIS